MPPLHPEEEARLRALHDTGLLDTPPEQVFERIAEFTAKMFHVPTALISLVDQDRQWFKACVGLDVRETPRDIAFCAYAILRPEVLVVSDPENDPRFAANPLVVGPPHIRFYAGAPLVTSTGYPIGTLCLIDYQHRDDFGSKEAESLAGLAGFAMELIETRRLHGFIDPVTRLPGRPILAEYFQAFAQGRGGEGGAVELLTIDICSPEQMNEIMRLFGPANADLLVKTASERVKSVMPEGAVLCHVSPIRFTILCPPGPEFDTGKLRDDLLMAFDTPVVAEGNVPVPLRRHVGIARYPDDAADIAGLIQASVAAISDARDQNADWALYDRQKHFAGRRAFDLLIDLRAALAAPQGQLFLVYQPKVTLESGLCTGVEALIRWRHPKLGLVSPADFIPIAEGSALMKPLTEWVLTQAIADSAEWREQGIDLIVAVNVSVENLQDKGFSGFIAGLLGSYDRAPIQIEVTESALMSDPDEVHAALTAVRALGVRVAIDDFGTGHSSLAYLKAFPADILKIDQVFISRLNKDPRDQTIVRATIDLARSLGYRVIAEGVENAETLALLSAWGCHAAQGYFIARPMEQAALLEWILERQRIPVLVSENRKPA